MNITINISEDEAMELINKIESMSIIKKECEQEKKKPDSFDNKMIRNNIKNKRYAKLFTNDSPYWNVNPDINWWFLRNAEIHLNEKLSVNGFVTLNQIYEELGFKAIREGNDIKWIDNGSHIDFDIKEMDIKNDVEISEPIYLIDFNFDECLY